MKKIYLLILFLILTSCLTAQDFILYDETNGLTENSITALFCDSQGRVWFGTSKDGVYRYENEEFTHFSYFSNGIFNGNLLGGIVIDFAEDSAGNIWIGATDILNQQGGIYQYDGAQINLIYSQTALLTDKVTSIFIDQNNNDELWIACRSVTSIGQAGGIQVFKEDTIITYAPTLNNSPNIDYTSDIKRKNSSEIAITGSGEAYCTIDSLGNFNVPEIMISCYNMPPTPFNSYAYNMAFDVGENEIYLSNGNKGVIYYNAEYDMWGKYEGDAAPSTNDVQYVFKDSENDLWCINEGSYKYYLNRLGSDNVWHNYLEFEKASDYSKRYIIEDEEKNLWINISGGVIKLSNAIGSNATSIKHYPKKSSIVYYPNPANQQLNIQVENKSNFLLLDQQGKVQKRGQLYITNNMLDTGNLPNGYYLLKVYNETHSSTHKILIQH